MLPSGLAIYASKHYTGFVSDFEIFQQSKEF